MTEYIKQYKAAWEKGVDISLISYPPGFIIGAQAFHEKSNRHVVLKSRELGDGWVVSPIDGARDFYEHSQFLKIQL